MQSPELIPGIRPAGQSHLALGALVLEGGLGKIERWWQSSTAWEPNVLVARGPMPHIDLAWGAPGTLHAVG